MTKIKPNNRDIGAQLRAGGIRKTRAHPVRQFRVNLPLSRGKQAVRPTVRPSIAIRRRLNTITSKPKTDRRLSWTELNDVEDPVSGLRHLSSDPSSLVLAINGVCSRNGLAEAEGAYGVFVSTRIPSLNESGILPVQFQQTNQYADLHSAMQALEIVHRFIMAGEDITHVILKTNSAYLEQGLSAHVWKWIGNGFRNCEGKPLLNGKAFKYLHERIKLLEGEYGMKVSVCWVPKEENEVAGLLSRSVLGEERRTKPAQREEGRGRREGRYGRDAERDDRGARNGDSMTRHALEGPRISMKSRDNGRGRSRSPNQYSRTMSRDNQWTDRSSSRTIYQDEYDSRDDYHYRSRGDSNVRGDDRHSGSRGRADIGDQLKGIEFAF